mmetsp:Transcript_17012/g.27627  ORF Transcript_17012/g.27627 Transcript_17012/m.27627 type:complete len:89 (-) Transcript_17012:174-440(-)
MIWKIMFFFQQKSTLKEEDGDGKSNKPRNINIDRGDTLVLYTPSIFIYPPSHPHHCGCLFYTTIKFDGTKIHFCRPTCGIMNLQHGKG